MAAPKTRAWSPTEELRFKAAWHDPSKSAEEIAKAHNRSVKAVQLHARRADYPPKDRKRPYRWTADSQGGQRMKELYIRQGHSAAEVASILTREMGVKVTREMVNSVSKRFKWGKANAAPAQLKRRVKPDPKPKAPKPKRKLVVMANTTVIEAGDTAPHYVVRKDVWDVLSGSEPQTTWGRKGCKWPVGPDSGADQLFCNEPTEKTYCEHHADIAFVPTSTAKELQRGLRKII